MCVQVVVDAFDSSVLVSNCATKVYDFGTVPEKALHDIVIPLQVGTHDASSPGQEGITVTLFR